MPDSRIGALNIFEVPSIRKKSKNRFLDYYLKIFYFAPIIISTVEILYII